MSLKVVIVDYKTQKKIVLFFVLTLGVYFIIIVFVFFYILNILKLKSRFTARSFLAKQRTQILVHCVYIDAVMSGFLIYIWFSKRLSLEPSPSFKS